MAQRSVIGRADPVHRQHRLGSPCRIRRDGQRDRSGNNLPQTRHRAGAVLYCRRLKRFHAVKRQIHYRAVHFHGQPNRHQYFSDGCRKRNRGRYKQLLQAYRREFVRFDRNRQQFDATERHQRSADLDIHLHDQRRRVYDKSIHLCVCPLSRSNRLYVQRYL